MKLNRKWLNEEFVDLSHVSDKEFVEKLTIFGQKVETYERMDAEIKNVVVGKVVTIREEDIVIETGADRNKMKLQRWAVNTNVTKTEQHKKEVEAAREAAKSKKDKKNDKKISDSAKEAEEKIEK